MLKLQTESQLTLTVNFRKKFFLIVFFIALVFIAKGFLGMTSMFLIVHIKDDVEEIIGAVSSKKFRRKIF